MTMPTLEGEHLVLRPFGLADAAEVQRLAGDFAVADTTLNVPHPYEDGMAEAWIGSHASAWEEGSLAAFAVTRRRDGQLLGAISLKMQPGGDVAELGYWIGSPFWGKGYATEAARLLIGFGFTSLGLARIAARHFARNPASGRVMQKIGMLKTGVDRQAGEKWGRCEDYVLYEIRREAWSRG
jgi:RimJ/RimL family protein N-acetyltransferase